MEYIDPINIKYEPCGFYRSWIQENKFQNCFSFKPYKNKFQLQNKKDLLVGNKMYIQHVSTLVNGLENHFTQIIFKKKVYSVIG